MSDEAPPPYPGPKVAEEDDSPSPPKATQEAFDNSKLPPPPPYTAVPTDGNHPQIFITNLRTPITVSPLAGGPIPTDTQRPERIENYLLMSICSMIFCCFPIGILATLLSCQVGILYQRGELHHAHVISQRARHVASIAIAVGSIASFFNFFREYKQGYTIYGNDIRNQGIHESTPAFMHPEVNFDDSSLATQMNVAGTSAPFFGETITTITTIN